MPLHNAVYVKRLLEDVSSLRKVGDHKGAKKLLEKGKKSQEYQDYKQDQHAQEILTSIHRHVKEILDDNPDIPNDIIVQIEEAIVDVISKKLDFLETAERAENDAPEVKYLQELEEYYQSIINDRYDESLSKYPHKNLSVDAARKNLKMTQKIVVYKEFISIGGIYLQRQNFDLNNIGVAEEHSNGVSILRGNYYFSQDIALELVGKKAIPSPEHWKAIYNAVPGQNKYEKNSHIKEILQLSALGYHCDNQPASRKEYSEWRYWSNAEYLSHHGEGAFFHIGGHQYDCIDHTLKGKKMSLRLLYLPDIKQ